MHGPVRCKTFADDGNQPTAGRKACQRLAHVCLDHLVAALALQAAARPAKRGIHDDHGGLYVWRKNIVQLFSVFPELPPLWPMMAQHVGPAGGQFVDDDGRAGHFAVDGEGAGAGRGFQHDVVLAQVGSPGRDEAQCRHRGILIEFLTAGRAPALRW
ncbi:hypothetical protein ACZ75_06705 [Massilia sp. NR 4-1]|nr:hypothetical protein ACZ75_06705 [Massilia sp. NR 4-1]